MNGESGFYMGYSSSIYTRLLKVDMQPEATSLTASVAFLNVDARLCIARSVSLDSSSLKGHGFDDVLVKWWWCYPSSRCM